MPYRHAHWWVTGVLGVILLGFWASYFSTAREAPAAFHFHGISATIWTLLVAAQSWLAHNKRLPLHRQLGMASLFLFPFLMMGFAAIIDYSAKKFVSGQPGAVTIFAAPFFVGMVLAMAAYVTVFYGALKHRRKVWLHAGYMLATPLILFESPFSRVLPLFIPYYEINSFEDLPVLMDSILTGIGIELAVCAYLLWKYRAKAMPFAVAGAFILVQGLGMRFSFGIETLEALMRVMGAWPSEAVLLGGFAIGAATSWLGWQAGKRPLVTGAGAPARA